MKPAWVKQSVWNALDDDGKPKSKPLILEMLTFSELPQGNSRYEVWSTPQQGAPYRVHYIENNVVINTHPFDTEVGARKFFERAVEDKYEEWYSRD
jgi:hypothetical protein